MPVESSRKGAKLIGAEVNEKGEWFLGTNQSHAGSGLGGNLEEGWAVGLSNLPLCAAGPSESIHMRAHNRRKMSPLLGVTNCERYGGRLRQMNQREGERKRSLTATFDLDQQFSSG